MSGAWYDADKAPANFRPVKVTWKHEGRAGPVYLTDASENARNFADGQPRRDGGHFAQWMTKREAMKLAHKLRLQFEEV